MEAMQDMKTINIAFIRAHWHKKIVGQAYEGFLAEMPDLGHPWAIDIVQVPGALEMPLIAKKLAETGKYDAVVAAALVVNGGIYRHEFVAAAVVDGLVRVGLDTGVPVFSVSLTPHEFQETPEHIDFFTRHFFKKGAEAARAVVMMVELARNDYQTLSESLEND